MAERIRRRSGFFGVERDWQLLARKSASNRRTGSLVESIDGVMRWRVEGEG
jgi:hypothetical protein